ncbi:hypothetical protein ACTXT7_006231 [Hymenolepis weldensis]
MSKMDWMPSQTRDGGRVINSPAWSTFKIVINRSRLICQITAASVVATFAICFCLPNYLPVCRPSIA